MKQIEDELNGLGYDGKSLLGLLDAVANIFNCSSTKGCVFGCESCKSGCSTQCSSCQGGNMNG